MVLGVFFVFFFFACENTNQTPDNRGTTTANGDSPRGRSASSSSRSSSSRSSGGSSNDSGSSDGDPPVETATCEQDNGTCPLATGLDDCPSLTTITFEERTGSSDDGEATCYGAMYRHPLFTNYGGDDFESCEDKCARDTYSPYGAKGSASPNQSTILRISDDDGFGDQFLYLNKDVVGPIDLSSSNNYYIYFEEEGETPVRVELTFNRNNTLFTCGCGGASTAILHTRSLETNIPIGCNNGEDHRIKFWLAKETEENDQRTCQFFH